MGCCGSKDAAYKEQLDALEATVTQRRWRAFDGQVGDLRMLEQAVTELRQLHEFYAGRGRNSSELHRVFALGKTITDDMMDMLSIELLRRRDLLSVQTIRKISKQLDSAGAVGASSKVQNKYEQLTKQMASETLKQVGVYLERIVGPENLVDGSRQALSTLQTAKLFVVEVLELVDMFLQCCTAFSVKIIELLGPATHATPTALTVLRKATDSIDTMCAELAKAKGGGARWDPLMPKVHEIGVMLSAELMPGKLEAFEAELDKPEGSTRSGVSESCSWTWWSSEKKAASSERADWTTLMESLDELGSLCVSPKPALLSRLEKALTTVEERIYEAFNGAIEGGESNKIDGLFTVAKQFDGHCTVIDSGTGRTGRTSLAQKMQRKRAGVTLKTLLANADGSVNKRTSLLHEAYVEADRNIKKVPRESLEERTTGARWKFKLNRGGFKEFTTEKSVEVEKLFQDWIKKGKPREEKGRRYEMSILVDTAASRKPTSRSLTAGAGKGDARRARCKYGEKCYRKSVEHRKEYCHPTDWDWEEEHSVVAPPPDSEPDGPPTRSESLMSVHTATIREERFSLDFALMTQVRLTGAGSGRRLLKREEGLTVAQKYTKTYYEQVVEFVKELETMFTQAEVELRLLGEEERRSIEKRVDDLVGAMQPALLEFLELAVYVKGKDSLKVINEIIALLGVHADRLGITGALKELQKNDVLDQLRVVYGKPEPGTMSRGPSKWDLLRMLCKRQVVGPKRLLGCRLALEKTKRDHETRTRQHLQMRCQALLTQYEDDEKFGQEFRKKAVEILAGSLQRAAMDRQPEVVQGILRTLVSWQCTVDSVMRSAGEMILSLVNSACNSQLQRLPRLVEVLETGHAVADTVKRPLMDFTDLNPVLPLVATKVLHEIELQLLGRDGEAEAKKMTHSLKQVVEMHNKLRDERLVSSFDEEFWRLFKPWYETVTNMAGNEAENARRSSLITEWAIAYSEQLKIQLPAWMMNKDQVEAVRKLQAANETQDEKQLREAVVFAKQADYKSDQKLAALYDSSVGLLRTLKRLPSGWDPGELVGDDATAKMFRKVDVDSADVKRLFQKIFNETQASIVTRDRVGDVPRGFAVEKIISVMNAESWFSYLQRADQIGDQCKKFPGSAPCSDKLWESWSGKIATKRTSEEILNAVRLPALQAKANEFLMFHGTKPEAAEQIAQNHFDMGFACKTGLFGAGLYFAESSSKSDEYVKPDAENRYPVIMCRVALGHINYVPHKDPTKDPGREKLEQSCLGGEYNSVLGDRKKAKGTYREFVVYDHYQVYPHFIVWYKRL